MRLRLAAVIASSATALAVGVAAPAADAGQRTHVVAHCSSVDYKPARYVFFCADAGAGLNGATYTDWTKTDAHGAGTYYRNDCRPSCAGGTVHQHSATFHLYRVVQTKKHGPLFTRIKVSWGTRDKVYGLPTSPI